MEIVYERCCGLDIHKKTVVACLITPDANGQRHKELRTFRTLTPDLLALHDWLRGARCTHLAMESTGVYWRPIFNLFEGDFTLLLVNAAHIKAVPGRKTDVRDAEGIADLVARRFAHRQLYLAGRPTRAAGTHPSSRQSGRRPCTRGQSPAQGAGRYQYQAGRCRHRYPGQVSTGDARSPAWRANRLAAVLAELARGRLRAKRTEWEQALVGVFKPHHRFLLTELLAQIDSLEQAITRVSNEIATHMHAPEPAEHDQPEQEVPSAAPADQPKPTSPLTWALAIALLCTIPGIGRRAAEGILAEIGLNMARFPTAAHLASWAGMCPGNHKSAGKRLSGRTRKGNSWLRMLLVEATHAAAHTKNTYLSAQ